MTNAELFSEGINLMISGMGFVLFFLFILIYAISFVSTIINKYFPDPIPIQTAKPTIVSSSDETERLRLVIAAAIHHHRRQQGFKK